MSKKYPLKNRNSGLAGNIGHVYVEAYNLNPLCEGCETRQTRLHWRTRLPLGLSLTSTERMVLFCYLEALSPTLCTELNSAATEVSHQLLRRIVPHLEFFSTRPWLYDLPCDAHPPSLPSLSLISLCTTSIPACSFYLLSQDYTSLFLLKILSAHPRSSLHRHSFQVASPSGVMTCLRQFLLFHRVFSEFYFHEQHTFLFTAISFSTSASPVACYFCWRLPAFDPTRCRSIFARRRRRGESTQTGSG